MRLRARVDGNHREIVEALRACGCSVADTSRMGRGFPDIVVGLRGRTVLLEIKDGSLVPSKQKLTPDEERFHATWRGEIAVVRSVAEALRAVGLTS